MQRVRSSQSSSRTKQPMAGFFPASTSAKRIRSCPYLRQVSKRFSVFFGVCVCPCLTQFVNTPHSKPHFLLAIWLFGHKCLIYPAFDDREKSVRSRSRLQDSRAFEPA